jgi:hypothetical protein
MNHRALLGLVVGVTAAAPGIAGAQNVAFYPDNYFGWDLDTAFAIAVGQTRTVQVYGANAGGVSSYNITVFFDTNVVRLVRADSVPGYGLPSPTITPLAEGAVLSATGAGYPSSGYLARLTFEMKTTAPAGTLFSLLLNEWLTQAGAPAAPWGFQTDLLNACLAPVLWGDPDSSLTITGRDALVALTSAVQLPVSGFDLAMADVDDDGAVTSRDALSMLSYAIGGSSYYYYYRTGFPEAGTCAPVEGVPSEMAFLRGSAGGNLYRVAAGDSVAVAVGSPTAFYPSHVVRWSPDGTTILATANTSPYYYEPIAVTLGTLAEDTLARVGNYDGGGTYSPDGARIAFFSDRSYPYTLWLMDASGANPGQAQDTILFTSYTTGNPAWSPDGQRVAFPGYATCCTNGLWTVLVADSTVRLEYPITSAVQPSFPSWSPAGDSLLFLANNRVYRVEAPDTVTVPREVVYLNGGVDWPSWTSAGIVFRLLRSWSSPGTYDYYLRRPDGRIVKIFRSAGTADAGASFR